MNTIKYDTPAVSEPPIELGTLVSMCNNTYIVAQHTNVNTAFQSGVSLINLSNGGRWTNRWTNAIEVAADVDWRDQLRKIINKHDGVILTPGTQLTITVQ